MRAFGAGSSSILRPARLCDVMSRFFTAEHSLVPPNLSCDEREIVILTAFVLTFCDIRLTAQRPPGLSISMAWDHGGADFQSRFDKSTAQTQEMKEGAFRVL